MQPKGVPSLHKCRGRKEDHMNKAKKIIESMLRWCKDMQQNEEDFKSIEAINQVKGANQMLLLVEDHIKFLASLHQLDKDEDEN